MCRISSNLFPSLHLHMACIAAGMAELNTIDSLQFVDWEGHSRRMQITVHLPLLGAIAFTTRETRSHLRHHRTSISDPPHFGQVGRLEDVLNLCSHSRHTTGNL